MPELPDLTVYLEHLDQCIVGERLNDIRIASAFVLRTVEPSVEEIVGRKVLRTERLGKQIVIVLEDEYFIVIHLMISGRLHWKQRGVAVPKRNGLAAFDFDSGSVTFTEASKKKRASIRLVRRREALLAYDAGGLEVLTSTIEDFSSALKQHNHTLKRALTDQHIVAGIGNAYSDEILLRAKLSPFKQVKSLDEDELRDLWNACRETLSEWIEILRSKAGEKFPEKVTAFHPEMAVHGKYREPCPVCGSPVQRIVYAENEANYCARCQTGGRLLADRSLSKLLKANWPKRIEELE